MMSPASHSTFCPLLQLGNGDYFLRPLVRQQTGVHIDAHFFQNASAWAFPRPSANASAKLANRTVNQSQSVTCRVKPKGAGGGIPDKDDRSNQGTDGRDEYHEVFG